MSSLHSVTAWVRERRTVVAWSGALTLVSGALLLPATAAAQTVLPTTPGSSAFTSAAYDSAAPAGAQQAALVQVAEPSPYRLPGSASSQDAVTVADSLAPAPAPETPPAPAARARAHPGPRAGARRPGVVRPDARRADQQPVRQEEPLVRGGLPHRCGLRGLRRHPAARGRRRHRGLGRVRRRVRQRGRPAALRRALRGVRAPVLALGAHAARP